MIESTIVCDKKKHIHKIIKVVRDLLGHDNIKIIYCKETLTGNIQFGVSYDDVTNYFERFGEKYDDDMLAYNFAQGLIENINFLFQEQKNG